LKYGIHPVAYISEQEEMSTDDEDSDEDGVPKAMSEEESCSGASDVDDMESVTVSEMPNSTHYDQDIDLDEEKRALATIKGMTISISDMVLSCLIESGCV
jgi:hypothetical protein